MHYLGETAPFHHELEFEYDDWESTCRGTKVWNGMKNIAWPGFPPVIVKWCKVMFVNMQSVHADAVTSTRL